MKKFLKVAYVSVITLLSMVGLAACSSSDEAVVDPNPTYDGNSVKTQFTISLPENIKMRMASATVQETGFRGIDEIKLIPYSGTVTSSSVANANLISLSAISAFDNADSHSKVYADVALAVGTNHFLFYGKAIDNVAGTAITSAADKFKFGALSISGLSGIPTLSSVTFAPVPIYEDGNDAEQTTIAAGKTVGTNLIAALNAVANAAPTEALSDGTKPKFKAVTSEQSNTINTLWNSFKELKTGSSKNVEWTLKKLYMNLDGLATTAAQNTVPDGYKLAVAIRTVIETYCDVTESDGVTTNVILKTAYQNYPASINLPDGAVFVGYVEDEFKAPTAAVATSWGTATLGSYVYPANLQYYVNSSLKTANSVKSPSYGTNTWDEILDLYTDGGAVGAETRSVAIEEPVQYGVGRLDATVQGLSSESGAKYYDNKGNELDVTNGYTLTGILIGGQKAVGWDFAAKGSTVYTIYDKTMNTGNSVVKKGTASAVNYTLVLQSGEEDADKSVNVALEFINNGSDFVGARGEIIPAGATFYLVGTLTPSATTDGDDDYKRRVFTQDYKTIATFTIKQGENNGSTDDESEKEGLGTATKGLPDLRTTQMELGLSVDLNWKSGLEFDVDI